MGIMQNKHRYVLPLNPSIYCSNRVHKIGNLQHECSSIEIVFHGGGSRSGLLLVSVIRSRGFEFQNFFCQRACFPIVP